MQQRFVLLPLLVFSLLIVACGSAAQQGGSTGVTPLPRVAFSPTASTTTGGTTSPVPSTTIRLTLEVAQGQGTPSPTQMQADSALLSERLATYGFENAQINQVTADNQPGLQVEIPHFGSNQSSTLESLLARGQLEFWLTGATPVQENTNFDPTQYAQYNNGSTSSLFTNTDVDGSKVFVAQGGQTGQPEINVAMKGNAVGRFFTFTQQNIGQYLAITLDRKVIMSAIIQSAINGPFVITGSFTSSQAKVIASIIKYAALPVALRISSEEVF